MRLYWLLPGVFLLCSLFAQADKDLPLDGNFVDAHIKFEIEDPKISWLMGGAYQHYFMIQPFYKSVNEDSSKMVFVVGEKASGDYYHITTFYYDAHFGLNKHRSEVVKDTLVICSQWPWNGNTECAHYVWVGEALQPVKSYTFDPSAYGVRKAQELLAQGQILGSINELKRTGYLSNYHNPAEMIAHVWKSANAVALRMLNEDEVDSALIILDAAYNFQINLVDSRETFDLNFYDSYMQWDWFVASLTRYGMVLKEKDRFTEASNLLRLSQKLDPSYKMNYLQLGDLYWNDGVYPTARDFYETYYKLMKANRMKKQVPERVKERMVWPKG